jgi:Rrf2 family transcriptional regulator, nitric oxide-sensitive transcriptional repressor
MQLTLHADYAFRVLLYLGSQPDGKIVSTKEISQSYGISHHHLVRVIQTLSDQGYVKVTPGRSGGVSLGRDAGEIRLGEVFRTAETNLKIVECFDPPTNTCPIIGICQLQPVLSEALAAFVNVLDRYTLTDLLEGRHRKRLEKAFEISRALKS